MKDFVGMNEADLDPVNNDWDPYSEKKIIADSVNYYKNSLSKFYKRPAEQRFSNKKINKTNEHYLYQIMLLLKKHRANYKIVITPLYDQVGLNPQDRITLNNIFGSESVFDYSGINTITQNKYNYGFDVVHYRKKVGDLIFKQIYK